MEWNSPDLNSWPAKLVKRVGKKIRSDKKFTQEAIRKNEERAVERRRRQSVKYGHDRRSVDSRPTEQGNVNELGERELSVFSQATTLMDHKDNTEMLHGLTHHDSFDSLLDYTGLGDKLKDPYFDSRDPNALELVHPLTEVYRRQLAALPKEVWERVVSFLNPAEAASLAIAARTIHKTLAGKQLQLLHEPENKHYKIIFLNQHDRHLPQHLLCFPCGKFHLRANPGTETLKVDYVNNALYNCPNVRASVLPRLRITHGRELPYSFVQLALRHEKHTVAHGIPASSLSRQWKCKDSDWTHRTRYIVHDNHLLMRVVSQVHAPPNVEMTETSIRHLLYDREEYSPFFSVCSHWRDGDLMPMCKCALSHIPAPPVSYAQQLKKAPRISRAAAHPSFIVRMCDDCRPARRCPECPTEYLIEIQMLEDKDDPVRPFKHAIVVTRWSDLGDGSSPYTSPEWAAVKGLDVEETGKEYESFSHVGRRAVSGIFESKVSGSIPGQRMVSLNPKNQKLGEEGHGWY